MLVINALERKRPASRANLSPEKNDPQPAPPKYRQRLDADRSRESRVLRQQALSGGQDLAAFFYVAAGIADPLGGLRRFLDDDFIALDRAKLLHHHRVGAGRDGRSREDPRRSSS